MVAGMPAYYAPCFELSLSLYRSDMYTWMYEETVCRNNQTPLQESMLLYNTVHLFPTQTVKCCIGERQHLRRVVLYASTLYLNVCLSLCCCCGCCYYAYAADIYNSTAAELFHSIATVFFFFLSLCCFTLFIFSTCFYSYACALYVCMPITETS